MNMSNGLKKNSKIKKVAFVINFADQKWLGGLNIIVNLIEALNNLPKLKIKPVLIVNKDMKVKKFEYLKNIQIIKNDFFLNKNLLNRIINKTSILIFGKSYEYENFFKRFDISILSHTLLPLGKNSELKSFPWIPDYQYIHYPENFSFKNRVMKTINTFFCAHSSTNIILSSKDVKNDIKKVSLSAYNKSEVNSFVFNIPSKNRIKNLNTLKNKYKIPSKFFYLPNQYWTHKNHFTVLKSLNSIINKGQSINIISTGFSEDHRKSGYFSEIKDFIKTKKLNENYFYLGTVDYIDVMSLMYHSISIINPSTFEGWSSSVEQGKSMGKKIVLSNIKVHKEQNPSRGIFFDPKNHNQLAKILINIWTNHDKKKEEKYIKLAYKNLKGRLTTYAKKYQDLILNEK